MLRDYEITNRHVTVLALPRIGDLDTGHALVVVKKPLNSFVRIKILIQYIY